MELPAAALVLVPAVHLEEPAGAKPKGQLGASSAASQSVSNVCCRGYLDEYHNAVDRMTRDDVGHAEQVPFPLYVMVVALRHFGEEALAAKML